MLNIMGNEKNCIMRHLCATGSFFIYWANILGYFASVTCLLSDPRKENVQNKHLSVNFLSYFVYQKNVTLFKYRKYLK